MAAMWNAFNRALSHRNGFVRKGAAAALQLPKHLHGLRAKSEDYLAAPPVLANSFPKSGTHLLFQIVDALPNATNYGAFLASMTSSFRFRERSPENASRFIRGIVPGEIVRGHLFFHPQNAADLAEKNVVHYFAYRDPRDVVISEAHYLREMNRWHRLAPYFRKLPSIDDAILLSITGFDPPIPGLEYPNIAARFARYEDWLKRDDCLAIRFEDLASENRFGRYPSNGGVLCSALPRSGRCRRVFGCDGGWHRAAQVAHVPQREKSWLAVRVQRSASRDVSQTGGRIADPAGL